MDARLERILVDAIDQTGPLPFRRFVDLALYSPAGFYEVGGRAGRRGDFITSSEVGPLFGAVIGRWLDATWRRLGCPDPFLVAEAGAGPGTLWRAVVRGNPECFEALRYTLVERSEAQRDVYDELPGSPAYRADLGPERWHVVLANELLDNLAFDVAVRATGHWCRLHVEHSDGALAFVDGPPDPALCWLDGFVEKPTTGTAVPICGSAIEWIEDACALSSTVLTLDYGASTNELAGRGPDGWCRGYRSHERIRGLDAVLRFAGECDITTDVAFDQLRRPHSVISQAEFLVANDIDDLVEEGRIAWASRTGPADLEAIALRSRIAEGAALMDPDGLGGFTVLEWRNDH